MSREGLIAEIRNKFDNKAKMPYSVWAKMPDSFWANMPDSFWAKKILGDLPDSILESILEFLKPESK